MMKTYLKVIFSADGAAPSKIEKALAGIGFRAVRGAHDFVYEWPGEATVDDVLEFGDRIHAEVGGLGCLFEMETV